MSRLLPALLILLCSSSHLAAQRVDDLVYTDASIPVRLVGYGLVIGLNGTGDRASGFAGRGATARSLSNLFDRVGIAIDESEIRSRNVAAVLVTAEAPAFGRAGARFDVHVSSLGDATSLEGGVLVGTPLAIGPDNEAFGQAQGPLVLDGEPSENNRRLTYAARRRSGTARVIDGGMMIVDPSVSAADSVLHLRLAKPDPVVAEGIRAAIAAELGEQFVQLVDPGMVSVSVAASERYTTLTRILALPVDSPSRHRLVFDRALGDVVSAGDIAVTQASVHIDGVHVDIDAAGSSVRELVRGLKDGGTSGETIARILLKLRDAGAIHAEITIR